MGDEDVAVVEAFLTGDGALVGHSGGAAGQNHVADVGWVGIVVGQPDAGSARHGEDEGVGCRPVVTKALVVFASGVVVVDEGHGITLPVGVAGNTLVAQGIPVVVVEHRLDGVLQREVEGCRLYLSVSGGVEGGLANPVDDAGVAVPVLAYGESRVGGGVIHSRVVGLVAFHHVEAEAYVAQFVEQEVLIGDAVLLHSGVHVVQVAVAAEVVALVVVARSVVGVAGGAAGIEFVVERDAPHLGLVGAPVDVVSLAGGGIGVALNGEVGPVVDSFLVVDYHVFDDAGAFLAVGLDHVYEFGLRSPYRVVLQPEAGVIAHRLHSVAVVPLVGLHLSRVGHPYQVEVFRQLVGAVGKVGPLGVVVAVPVERLQHYATVVGRPSLCHRQQGKAQQQ